MILSGQTIRRLKILTPFEEKGSQNGMSYGLSAAGYDLRLQLYMAQEVRLKKGDFLLVASKEHFIMPGHVMGIVHDKSTWARKGMCVQNTVIEPGWRGYLTLELTNHGKDELVLHNGDPIAQVVFHYVDKEVEKPYNGKYQDQEPGPQEARHEK